MANHRKSIIDKALLEAEEIDKAFEANAKEILAQTMGSEIEEMVKESLEGSMALTEDDDDGEVELEVSDEIGIDTDDDGETDFELDLEADEDNGDDIEDIDLDLDIEDDIDLEGGEIETIDLTGADDSDVITVFKKMGPEDEIEVVQDGDTIDIKDNGTGAEYRVELGGEGGDMDMDMDIDLEMDDMDAIEDMEGLGDYEGMDDMDVDMDDMEVIDGDDLGMDDDMEDDMSEEVVYEIEITEEDDEMEEMVETDDMDDDEYMEDEMSEAPRTMSKLKGRKYGNPNPRDGRGRRNESTARNAKTIKENKVLKTKINKVVTENKELKEDYNKLVDALKTFRTKLNEVAVFNSNLTYAVRLFTENSTTKEEKIDIIKQFDEVKSLKESKMMYKSLLKDVSKKSPIKESIDEKINETKGSGSSAQISESKVYVHPELEKMKGLWEFNYKY